MIEIEPDVLRHDVEQDLSTENFAVTTTADAATVRRALDAAALRFMRVDENGVEHPDDAAAQDALESGLYTPNYVADTEETAAGFEVYVDCKGVTPDPMGATFRRILSEELEAAGIVDARVVAVA